MTTTTDAAARPLPDAPLTVSFGGGWDSTAVLVGLVQRDIRPALILFADTGAEKPETYRWIARMSAWLESKGFPAVTIVRRQPPRAMYRTLEGACLQTGTLPSLAYGGKSCSIKWKIEPMHAFLRTWEPAVEAWAAGGAIVTAIGYDCGDKDSRRGMSGRKGDQRNVTTELDAKGPGTAKSPKPVQAWYPLRSWGWDREECARQIVAAGLPHPDSDGGVVKSACYFCPSSKPCELRDLAARHPELFRRAIALEDRARPNLENVEGLWRKATSSRPGSWRAFAEAEGLPLPEDVDTPDTGELERAAVLEERAAGTTGPRNRMRVDPETPAELLERHGLEVEPELEVVEEPEAEAARPLCYASGLSRRSNARPFILAGAPIGVVAGELSADDRVQVALYAGRGGRVFVDSGAFTAATKGRAVDWGRVLDTYAELAGACAEPANLAVVAPDVVGDQRATLELQRDYRDRLQALELQGATILLPLQRGELAGEALWRAALEASGLADPVAALPFNLHAWGREDVLELLSTGAIRRAHLLGAGPGKLEPIAAAAPAGVEVMGDAVRMLAWVGTYAVKGGRNRRRVTRLVHGDDPFENALDADWDVVDAECEAGLDSAEDWAELKRQAKAEALWETALEAFGWNPGVSFPFPPAMLEAFQPVSREDLEELADLTEEVLAERAAAPAETGRRPVREEVLERRRALAVRCAHCGEEEVLEVLEVWPEERAFVVETCCEELEADFHALAPLFSEEDWRALFAQVGVPVRRVLWGHETAGASSPIDFGLRLGSISLGEAKAFVARHHRHHGPSLSWRWGHGVWNGAELVAVAMVGRPVARMIDGRTTVEVTRVAVLEHEEPELVRNACSMLYGAAAREARRRGFEKAITYTLEEEDGGSLRASGWTPEAKTRPGTRSGSWSSRPGRSTSTPAGRKTRWARYLRRGKRARVGAA